MLNFFSGSPVAAKDGDSVEAVEEQCNNQPNDALSTDLKIAIGAGRFSLSAAIVTSDVFKRTKFATALTSTSFLKNGSFDLGDNWTLSWVRAGSPSGGGFSPGFTIGTLIVKDTTESGREAALAADFTLFVDHLLGRKPLEALDFRSIIPAFKRLSQQARFWNLTGPQNAVEIPYRLWTKTRWSDLAGCYVLSNADRQLLRMHPMAIQLPDGTVQGIRVLPKVDFESEPMRGKVLAMLGCEKEMERVVAVFEYLECRVVLLESVETIAFLRRVVPRSADGSLETLEPNSNDESTTYPSLAGTVREALLRRNEDSNANASNAPEGNYFEKKRFASQILLKLPHTDRVVAYDLPVNEFLRVPNGIDYPAFYRRIDRFVFVFKANFALEVQDITDPTTGVTKIRVGLSRVGNAPKPAAAPQATASPQSAGASMISLFKSAGSPTADDKKKRGTWQCYHPDLHVRYSPSLKWIRELGNVSKCKLFSWGAVLTAAEVTSPFAVLSIDHPELKQLFGERINIYLRGFPSSILSRQDIDVTATPGLERVYICAVNQIASANIVPGQNRIDFEIAEQGKRYKLRLVHIDVPEGAPSGSNLKFLHSLGMLVEFDTKKGMYYQNEVCKQLCPKYSSGSVKQRYPAAGAASVTSQPSTSERDEYEEATNDEIGEQDSTDE